MSIVIESLTIEISGKCPICRIDFTYLTTHLWKRHGYPYPKRGIPK